MTEDNDAAGDPSTATAIDRPTWRFLWRRRRTYLIFALLSGAVVTFYSPGCCKYRALKVIKNSGGRVWFMPFRGMAWVPHRLQRTLRTTYERTSWPIFIDHPCYLSHGESGRIPRRALEAFVEIGKIDWIVLYDRSLSDDDLAILGQMNSIRILDIDHSLITDEGLRHLASLDSIEHLSVVGTRVTSTGVERFQKAHPECNVQSHRQDTGPPTKDGIHYIE